MKTIYVSIEKDTVTADGNTCSFYEAGLYVNDDNQVIEGQYPRITDRDEIKEILTDKYEGQDIEVIFS